MGDFNGDGKQDLAVANYSSSTVSVLLGDGSGGFAAATDYATGPGPTSVAVGDVNDDGDQDLAVANSSDGTVSIFLGDGSGGFAPKMDFASGQGARSVAIGDFNGDGIPDLATADAQAGTVSVLLNVPWGTTAIDGGAAATAGRIVSIDSSAYGATQMRLRDQGGTWTAWQSFASYTYWTLPSGDGPKTVEVQYRNATQRSPVQSATILLDTTPPTTTDDAPGGWQNATDVPVTVSLTADDGSGSGVAETQYKVDGAASWSSGDSVVLSTDGTHTMKYRSVDNAGNVEETQYTTVNIDATAPDVSLLGVDDAWHAGPVMALITATTRPRACRRPAMTSTAPVGCPAAACW